MKYKILNEGIANDFCYAGVDYDYDGRDCTDPDCGCRHDDYCRRNFYVNLHVTDIDLKAVRAHLLAPSDNKKAETNTRDNTFVDYCVDRLLRIHKVYDPYKWEINTCGGYYGDEVESISFTYFGSLVTAIKEILQLPPNKRIEYILQAEYQYLIPVVKNRKWHPIKVPTSLLLAKNEEWLRKIDGDSYKEWPDPDMPIGVYIVDDDRYKLVDGYHRFVELVENQKYPEVTIIASA